MIVKEYILEDLKGNIITGNVIKWIDKDYNMSDNIAIGKSCIVDPQFGNARAFVSEPIESIIEANSASLKFKTKSHVYVLRENIQHILL